MEFLKPKTSCKTSCFFLNDAMFWRCFWKNIDVDVFDDVLQNAKHRAYDASNDVNRPPLSGRQKPCFLCTNIRCFPKIVISGPFVFLVDRSQSLYYSFLRRSDQKLANGSFGWRVMSCRDMFMVLFLWKNIPKTYGCSTLPPRPWLV